MQFARYGRLNVSGTVLSKRKIVELVNKGHVRAWDDPRLYTLIALRRRGVPPGAILSFVNELGVTKATTNIELRRFETSIRRYLELTVPRLMLVLEPLTVVIDGLDDDHLDMVDVPFSKNPAYGVSSSHSSLSSCRYTSIPVLARLIICMYSRTAFPSPRRCILSAATFVRWIRMTTSALRLGRLSAY